MGFLIFSASVNATTLNYTSMPGSLSPQDSKGFSCLITEAGVLKKQLGGTGLINKAVHMATVYSNDIPNVSVLQSLIADAAYFQLSNNQIAPIGGSNEVYSGTTDTDTDVVLLHKTAGLVVSFNTSPSAGKVEAFIDANCNQ